MIRMKYIKSASRWMFSDPEWSGEGKPFIIFSGGVDITTNNISDIFPISEVQKDFYLTMCPVTGYYLKIKDGPLFLNKSFIDVIRVMEGC